MDKIEQAILFCKGLQDLNRTMISISLILPMLKEIKEENEKLNLDE
tara:strand:- start:205 stop:342 length:138 start_codon:yes stop_codon:yes gene_type:complete